MNVNASSNVNANGPSLGLTGGEHGGAIAIDGGGCALEIGFGTVSYRNDQDDHFCIAAAPGGNNSGGQDIVMNVNANDTAEIIC